MDAMTVGETIYHASCYADYKKDEGLTAERTATPDSVLGKRKAEVRLWLPYVVEQVC